MKNLKIFPIWIAPMVSILLFCSIANADFSNEGKKNDCESDIGIQSVPEDYDCSQRDAMKWASHNPETIARDRIVTVSVTGGVPPYVWSVEGTGFELAQEATSKGSNKLSSGSSACGSATIEVAGADGQKVVGYVRCTSGTWVRIKTDHSCNWGWGSSVWCEKTEGKYYYRVFAAHGAHSPCTEECIHFYCVYNPCNFCDHCGTPREKYLHIGSTSRAEISEWRCR